MQNVNVQPRPPRQPGYARRSSFSAWPLRTKLLLATLALLAAMSATVGLIGYGAMNVYLSGQLDQQLEEASNRAIHFGLLFHGADETPPDPLAAPAQGAGTLNARISDGEFWRAGLLTPAGHRQDLPEEDVQQLGSLAVGAPPVDRTLSVGSYRLIARADEEDESVIITGLPLAGKDRTLASLTTTTAAVSLAGLAATGLLGLVIIRRTLRPLEDLSAVATRVSKLPLDQGDVALSVRVPPAAAQPVTEVGRLGHAFNLMLDNVAGALGARRRIETQLRRFVADASHELRTPLATIRGYAELIRFTQPLAPDGRLYLERVESESLRMTALVEDLLLLARLDEGHPPQEEDVDLTQLVVESVSDAQAAAPAHTWRVQLPDEPVTVRGDERQLRQVLINLLANAHRHTGPGTTVVAALRREAGAGAVVTVTDDGPGIAPDLMDRIFSRFTQGDPARSDSGSHGLGLSIADAIVAAHGGRIGVSSRPGRTEFTVRLPAAGPACQPDPVPDTL
ncbi:sensor histidine kinase [Arthrobacter mobilis]|uniref:histidine kinase n=1 Tax=Arthrobacter mobilis TaxID=2724944 RepID=A0A7X6K4M2_9MICC|nr:HAMP domain-containing sensor histidine kinase [Arthrobacter mobilis]NKX55492.1 HAMP domain-containing histidine kinase [Arthrobacter mobilis]